MLASAAASALGRLVASPAAATGARFFAAAALPAAGQKIGFVGLGKMGSRMVNRLLDAGNTVVAYDANNLALMRARDAARDHSTGTLEVRSCPADISADTDVPVILSMLPNAGASKDAYLGDKGLFKVPGGPKASIFVDCTTVDPNTTRQLAAAAGMLRLPQDAAYLPGYDLRDGKPHLLDAPVTGAVIGAEAGTLTFMLGGHPKAADAVQPVLMQMGKHAYYMGKHSSGLIAKLCNNLVLAASMAAVSESLALGKRMGLDPALLTQVLNHGAARCWASESYNPVPGVIKNETLPANRGYRAGLPTATVAEHLQMLTEAAKVAKSPAPMTHHVQELYERVSHEGLGDKDFSSIFRYVYGSGCANSEWQDGQQLFSSQIP